MSSLALLVPVLPSILLFISISSLARAVHLNLFARHFKLTFADAPVWSLFYFSAWSLLVLLLFPAQVAALFSQVTMLGYLGLLFLFVVVFPYIYRSMRLHDGNPVWLASLYPAEGMLTLEERYILAKIADVIFQQLVAGSLILTLSWAGVPYPLIVGAFIVLFACAHLYLFKTAGFLWGLHYTMYAALGGFAFPFLILYVPGGIAYSIVLHMLFYVLSAVFFAKLPRPSAAVCHDIIGVAPNQP